MNARKEKAEKIKMNKKSKYIKSQNYKCILKIHQDKSDEFKKKNKMIKNYQDNIKKNLDMISYYQDNIKKSVDVNKSTDYKLKIYHLLESNKDIEKEKQYLESGQKELDYILNTCDLIRKYIELEDLEKEILSKVEEEQEDQEFNDKIYDINNAKNIIIDEYMTIIDKNYSNAKYTFDTDELICNTCNIKFEIIDGCSTCYKCGATKSCIHVSSDLSYKEKIESPLPYHYTYKKETHLEDWIRRFTAREHKDIPQSVLDSVIMESQKERIKDLNNLTEEKVKKYLKRLDLNDYYDNVISIINRINKRPPFILTSEIESKIKTMFQQIQIPFEKYKSKRKNMLSYSYLLHKFFQILDLPEFSKYFFLLKSPEKLRQQDEIFKKIVEEMAQIDTTTKWRFFPSV